jgi:hypothetical protein
MSEAAETGAAALLRELARVQQRNAERAADLALDHALSVLAAWQVRRLRGTYADLEASPRYAPAMAFFESDLYGGTDFAQRDADLVRVVPAMRRLLPESVLETVATAVALNALSQELDHAMIHLLGPRTFTVAEYCRAYRAIGRYELRLRQIRLIGEVGAALDHYVHKPMLRTALKMMRRPAHLAGLAALQDFLERGFNAFAEMGGAVDFLATIESRETMIHEAIANGADDPFPDPAAGPAPDQARFEGPVS